jgi:hypothetical protein
MTNISDKLKEQVPDFVANIPIMDNIYNAQANKLEEIKSINEDVFNQLFVETATWGLELWERFCGLLVRNDLDYLTRRAKIRAHLASYRSVSKSVIKEIAKDFGFRDVEIIEDYAPYVVKLIFDNSDESKINVTDLIQTLRDMCPAHLDLIYLFVYKSWKDIHDKNMTFDTLKLYQWREYAEFDDTSIDKTDILKLNKWVDGDLFSMYGFNQNFTKIDKAVNNHRHDGISAPKIKTSHIAYEHEEIGTLVDTSNNLMTATKRLMRKTISEDEKKNFCKLWGYNTTDENRTWKNITKEIDKTRGLLIDALQRKDVDIPMDVALNRLSDYIKNIDTGIIPKGTAMPQDVLEGQTFINAYGNQVGTVKVNTEKFFYPTSEGITLNNIKTQNCYVQGDENLIAKNISEKKTIYGVRGSVAQADYPYESNINISQVSNNLLTNINWITKANHDVKFSCVTDFYTYLANKEYVTVINQAGYKVNTISKKTLLRQVGILEKDINKYEIIGIDSDNSNYALVAFNNIDDNKSATVILSEACPPILGGNTYNFLIEKFSMTDVYTAILHSKNKLEIMHHTGEHYYLTVENNIDIQSIYISLKTLNNIQTRIVTYVYLNSNNEHILSIRKMDYTYEKVHELPLKDVILKSGIPNINSFKLLNYKIKSGLVHIIGHTYNNNIYTPYIFNVNHFAGYNGESIIVLDTNKVNVAELLKLTNSSLTVSNVSACLVDFLQDAINLVIKKTDNTSILAVIKYDEKTSLSQISYKLYEKFEVNDLDILSFDYNNNISAYVTTLEDETIKGLKIKAMPKTLTILS